MGRDGAVHRGVRNRPPAHEHGFIVLLLLRVLLLSCFVALNHRQELPSAARIGRQALSLALVALCSG